MSATHDQSTSTQPVDNGSAPAASRRDFLKDFLFGGIVLWVATALYTAGRFLSPPRSRASRVPKSVELEKKANEIPDNSGFIFPYGSKPAILIRKESGKLSAYFATCPHLGCTVQYDPKSRHILCACHEGVFDLNGKNIDGPPPGPLEKLRVRVDSKDKITVSLTGDKKA